jgi:hypothetical protein
MDGSLYISTGKGNTIATVIGMHALKYVDFQQYQGEASETGLGMATPVLFELAVIVHCLFNLGPILSGFHS